MNERKGFEAFCKRTNPKYKPTDDSVIDRALWKTWQEAEALLREMVALKEACEAVDWKRLLCNWRK